MRAIKDMSVLITGGGSGIGAGCAELFVEGGAKVTITGRRLDKVTEVAKRIGSACHAVAGDVTVEADRERMVAAAVAHGGKLDVLINNAGSMYRQAVGAYTEEFLKEAFNTNVISGMMLASRALPHVVTSQGAIIFVGSTHTRRAFPGASPYATTKAAVEGLTRVMAAELGPQQVRVNCVLPGAVSTELNLRAGLFNSEEAAARYKAVAGLHALGRIGTARELAEAIEFLSRAEWVTGVALEVDGGIGLGVSNF